MNEIDRRRLGEVAAALAGLLAGGAFAAESAPAPAPKSGDGHNMSEMPANWRGREKIVFLAYPGFTSLDLVGPHYMLANLMGARVEIAAKTRDVIRCDTGLIITPTLRFDEVNGEADILCVPGGAAGTLAAMRDDETIRFIRRIGARARYVTSVCTGSLLLGCAGLLEGYRATSHWVTAPLLPVFGALPTARRVVHDRNRITAAGVTAGLDFALALVAELRDRRYAESLQLLAQYAPAPPFNAGDPSTAPAAATAMIKSMFTGLESEMRVAGQAAYNKSKGL